MLGALAASVCVCVCVFCIVWRFTVKKRRNEFAERHFGRDLTPVIYEPEPQQMDSDAAAEREALNGGVNPWAYGNANLNENPIHQF